MSYAITYTKEAIRVLRKMPRKLASNIVSKIDQLADGGQSQAANIKKLQGRAACRLRVGDYRVIYSLDHGQFIIVVIRIAPRGDVYE